MRIITRHGLALTWALMSLMVDAHAQLPKGREFHVDPAHGEDGAAGAQQSPVRSLASLVGKLKPGDTVILAAGNYTEGVVFTDSGTADRPIVIRNADHQKPIVTHSTWKLEGASHLVLRGLTFKECSPALVIGPNAGDNLIRANEFIDCPPKGRKDYERAIFGQVPNSHRNRIEDNVFARAYEPLNGEGPEAINVVEGNQHWIIRDNRISGYMYAVDIGYHLGNDIPGYIVVQNNEFFDCHEGVHIKSSDNIIRGNHIHDLQDVGFMMCSTGVFLRIALRTTVENNRIERVGAGVRVLQHDQLIRNNLIADARIGIWLARHGYGRATHSNWLVHNTVIRTRLPVWVAGGAEAYVFNNVFVGTSKSAMAVFVSGFHKEHPLATATDAFPDPKWYQHYAGAISPSEPSARIIADYNLFHLAEQPPDRWPLRGPDYADSKWWTVHNRQGAPDFVDPTKGDYRLRAGSPGRNAGRWVPNCAYDAHGRVRSLNAPDCGAFETGAADDAERSD